MVRFGCPNLLQFKLFVKEVKILVQVLFISYQG